MVNAKMRKKLKIALVFAAFILLSFQLFADERQLAVMPFIDKSGKLKSKVVEDESNWMRTQFIKKAKGKFRVISAAEQEKAIKKIKKDSYRLDRDKNGQIALGKAISAQKIIFTVIRSFGSQYTVNCELIDLETESTDDAASEDFDGSPRSFRNAVTSIIEQLLEGAEKEDKCRNSTNLESAPTTMTWQQAYAYCGKLGKRLPNPAELKALTKCGQNYYGTLWSSQTSGSFATFVNSQSGHIGSNNKYERYNVICVEL